MFHLHYLQYGLLLVYLLLRIPALARRCSATVKAGLMALAAVSVAAHPVLMAMGLTRSWDSVSWILGITGFMFTSAGLFGVMLLLYDIISGIGRLFSRIFRAGRRQVVFFQDHMGAPVRVSPVPLVLLAAAVLLAAWGTWQGRKMPDERRITIVLPRMAPGLDGMKIAHVSDLHLSPYFPHERVLKIFERVNDFRPDLIFITGDIADGTPTARAGDMEFLEHLGNPARTVLIPGNHEYYIDFEGWQEFYRSCGAVYLENRNRHFYIRDELVTVAGVTDEAAERRGREAPDLDKALRAASLPGDDALRILLDHRPGHAWANSDPKYGIDLQLSGHTHGSQLIAIYPIVYWQNEGLVKGFRWIGDMALSISSGAGFWSGFPVRIGAPSDVTLITLRSGIKAAEDSAAKQP